MTRWWLNKLRKPQVGQSSLVGCTRGVSPTSNVQFVSFLAESGFRQTNPDRYERSLRRRKLAAYGFLGLVLLGFAWVAMESAHALSLF
ncbi:MAG: hypothetical protein EA425_15545 [Puniceicoccaceae bacterium]|nr:MAG: hypothetical protein EA425_15545 [Puniceicoccaceae bacterium]